MKLRLLIIGSVFLSIGLLFIFLNKYFVAYFIYLNRLFLRMSGANNSELQSNKLLKSKSYKYFYKIFVYITGILFILAGIAMVRGFS